MSRENAFPRRTFLRGLGTLVALPMLDYVSPAARALAATPLAGGIAAASAFPIRVAWVYAPNGKIMENWTPAATGRDYVLPKTLEPLADYKNDFAVVTGLALNPANALGDGGGDHARANAAYLTGCHPRKTAGADIRLGISVDQIAAAKLGTQTKLPSIELTCDNMPRTGSCDPGYSCAYQLNLSWRSETQPMNPEVDPRAAFERLFGDTDATQSKEVAARRAALNVSVLDYVQADSKAISARLGAADKRKLDEYYTAVRELETRIGRAEDTASRLPKGTHTPEMFETYQQQIHLMYDILALAFQTDSTRVGTFILGHDGGNRSYPFIGVPDGHHDISHHRNDPAKIAKVALINRFHIEQLAYFIGKLKSIKEGNGTLLDNCIIQYGSGISDGNRHIHENLPCLLAGGPIKTGQHIKLDTDVPVTNFYRSLLDRIGVPTEKVGDSTGTLDSIFA